MTKKQKVLDYNINMLLFPSEKIYRIITIIDQELRKLYSSYNILTLYKTVAYSGIRDNEAQFESLLKRVEKGIDKIPKKVKIEHKDDEAFRVNFYGISCFLDEAREFSELKNMNDLEEKFYNLADRLYQLNIHPYDYI